jgi:predicted regulator of Ras-like GTPase activity (Roadblock/LC7/MglB family)
MTSLQEILVDISKDPAVKGCAIVTSDGMLVGTTLAKEVRDDVLAGLVSFLTATTTRALQHGKLGGFHRFVVHSTHGKLILIRLPDAFLAVMTDQFAETDKLLGEIQESASLLSQMIRIEV